MSLILEALKKSEKERKEKAAVHTGMAAPGEEQDDPARERHKRLRLIALIVAAPFVGFAVAFGVVVAFYGGNLTTTAKGPPGKVAEKPTDKSAGKAAKKFPGNSPGKPPGKSEAKPPAEVSPSAPPPQRSAIAPPAPTPAPRERPMPKTAAAEPPPQPATPMKTPDALALSPPPPSAAPATPEKQGWLSAVRVPRKPESAQPSAPADALPERLIREARGFEEKGIYDRAIDAYTRAIALDGDRAEAYFGRGWSRVGKAAYGDAIGDFSRAVALDADFAEAFFGRAWAMEKAGDVDNAILEYGEAIRLRPGYADAHFSRGVLEFTTGRLDAAAQDFAAVHAEGTGKLRDFALLWRYVAEARGGVMAPSVAFDNWRGGDPWPDALVKLFRGEATPTQVIVSAKDRDAQRQRENECVAYFFLAQHMLIQGDRKSAADYFRRTLATGVTYFRQYAVAKLELDRIAPSN